MTPTFNPPLQTLSHPPPLCLIWNITNHQSDNEFPVIFKKLTFSKVFHPRWHCYLMCPQRRAGFLSLFLLVPYPNRAISQRKTVDPRPPMLFSRNRPLLSRNCTSLKIASDPLQFPRTAPISLVNSKSPPRIISSPDSEWQFAFCVVIKEKTTTRFWQCPHLQMSLINILWADSL